MADRPSSQKKDIPNKKGKTNWVEKAGGLPKYIERVAKHIYESTGDVSRAIAGAVSQTKKRAAKGNEEAIAAIAQWEAMKASTKNASIETDEDMAMHLAVQISVEADEEFDMDAYQLALSAARTERGLEQHEDGGPIDVIAPEDFDYGRYALALNQERQVRGLTLAGVQERPLHMAITFDPAAHPRDLKGRFKETIGSLEVGGSVDLPDGTRVTNTGSNFKVVSPDHGKATQIKSADTAAEKALAYSGSSTNPNSVGGARSYPSSDRAVKAHEKKAGETTGGGEGEATGIDKDIADLEKAYAAAQKSGNAKVRNDTFQRLQRLKKARDANAPEAEGAEDETFKVVPSKGGSGAPPGQWTQHSSGDLEIEMPDGGPTARITEAEHGGPGTWSANVFPDAEASDSQSRDDFQSADEAREWAQERIQSGDIAPSAPEGEEAPDAALQEFAAGLPEGWEWNGTGDPDYGELLGPNDERVTVEADDDDGWYAVNEESGAEGTGATPAEAFAAIAGGGGDEPPEATDAGVKTQDVGGLYDADEMYAIETALEHHKGQDEDANDDFDRELDGILTGLQAGSLTQEQTDTFLDVLTEEIDASEENLKEDGDDEDERAYLQKMQTARDKLNAQTGGEGAPAGPGSSSKPPAEVHDAFTKAFPPETGWKMWPQESGPGVFYYSIVTDEEDNERFGHSVEITQNDDGSFNVQGFNEELDEDYYRAGEPESAVEPEMDVPAQYLDAALQKIRERFAEEG